MPCIAATWFDNMICGNGGMGKPLIRYCYRTKKNVHTLATRCISPFLLFPPPFISASHLCVSDVIYPTHYSCVLVLGCTHSAEGLVVIAVLRASRFTFNLTWAFLPFLQERRAEWVVAYKHICLPADRSTLTPHPKHYKHLVLSHSAEPYTFWLPGHDCQY